MFGTYNRLGVSIYASNVTVIKAVAKKFKRASLHNREVREARHQVYRQMIKYHADARDLAHQWRM